MRVRNYWVAVLGAAVLMFVLPGKVRAAADMTGWTEYDPFSRWNYLNPDTFTGRMEESGSSGQVGPGWVVSDFVLPATAQFTLTAEV